MCKTTGVLLLLVLSLLALSASAARAEWVVDAEGKCVRIWTPASLARGPLAIADAPLVPARYLAGGIDELGDPPDPAWSKVERGGFAAGYVPLAGVTGFGAMLSSIGFGLMDTLTGGYFELTPDDPQRFTVQPEKLGVFSPEAFDGTRSEQRLDNCGRPLFPFS
jgi:hypothetical protein